MANFHRSDLRYNYTAQSAGGNCKKVRGFPSNVVLNRNEGYEVLHFINHYMSRRHYSQLVTFERIEEAIKTKLPFDTSYANVKKWLRQNYNF